MSDSERSSRIKLAALEAQVYRAPIEMPVQTSFGLMRNRPAVLVRAVDDDGSEGWGEVWCNFPSVGAEHRARLITDCVMPLLVGCEHASPEKAFHALSSNLQVLAIQSGEFGPLAQVIAGVDIALWDLVARRAGLPIYRLFSEKPVERVVVYASGLNPDSPEKLASARRADGHRSFKLKVGFGRDRDLANLQALRETLGTECALMVDANQAWEFEEATAMAHDMAAFDPTWLEEPLRADTPRQHWRSLARSAPLPLAAGENIRGAEIFAETIREGALQVIQPDIAKWGGFSGCVPVGRQAVAAGRRFCPHWLGGGIGLVASMHLLAAVGGDGMVEIDSNPNELRSLMAGDFERITDGTVAMPDTPGLGSTPDPEALKVFRVTL